MIKKVFFPGTFVPQETIAAINRRIGRFAVYQPVMGLSPKMLEGLAGTGAIELRHPVIGKEAYLQELCRAYSSWGGFYQKDALRLKRLADDGFYNQDFAAEIKSQILKSEGTGRSGSKKTVAETADPMVNARMFLQLAQDFDLSESEIQQGLEKAEKASRQLFEQLRGEKPSKKKSRGAGAIPDAGEVMTDARLAAWFLLSRTDAYLPDIFVTDSRAVMARLLEHFESMARIMETTAVSGSADDELEARFKSIAHTPWPGRDGAAELFSYLDAVAEDDYILDFYAVPDVNAAKVIASFTNIPMDPQRSDGSRHAFFCCISKNPQ
jgi:hypothetical protein